MQSYAATTTKVAMKRMAGLQHSQLFTYATKLIAPAAENEATAKQILSGKTRLSFVPAGLNTEMTVLVEGEPIDLAAGTIWVPAAPGQRFDFCQNKIQRDVLAGSGELSTRFFCGNLSLPVPRDIQLVPTPFVLKGATSQGAVWDATDPRYASGLTREQALATRISKLPTVIGSGGTSTLAKITAVSGRWLEVQTMGDVRAEVATAVTGWAKAFLERGPWRGVKKLASLSKEYDVVLTVEQYYVPDGGDGDGGFWILADTVGSIKKKADLVGIWLSVAYMPSMGLPKLPRRVAEPPKAVVDVLGAEACLPPAASADGGPSASPAGSYWSVEGSAKRSRTPAKAPLNSGLTML